MQAEGSTAFRRRLLIGADHPAFAGHFADRPVLPGVVLLAEVLESIRGEPELAQAVGAEPLLLAAKFLTPVGPGSELQIELRLSGSSLDFDVLAAGKTAAKGRYQTFAR